MHLLKKVGKVVAIVLLSLLVVGFLTVLFYGKEMKQMVITELNEHLATKLQVGEFDFSVFRHFPYASFEMKKVLIEEVTQSEKKDTLLYSDRLSLLFNIMDVFSKDVTIKKIIVTNGKVNIRIDESGKGNYHFWKASTDTSGAGAIDIQKIGLKNVYLTYLDKKDEQDYAMLAKNSELSGHFSSEQFILKTKAELFVDRLRVHEVNYVNHKTVVINSGLNVNSKTGLYKFDESNIKIAGVEFNVAGNIAHAPSWSIDLAIKANEADVASFITVLPPAFTKYLSNYKSKGKFLFTSVVKGQIDSKHTPAVSVAFSVKDGSLASKTESATLDKLNFAGSFSNDNGKTVLDIPSLTASLSGHYIQASIRLDDFPDAYLTLKAKTQLNLKEIQPFIQSDTLESLSGDLAMNVSYAGKVKELSDFHSGKLYNIHAAGNIDISHVCFKLKKNPLEFKNMSGNFSLHDNDIYVKNFTGNISSTDFRVDGVFKNFVSFILIPGQPGEMQATVTSASVELDELLVNKSASTSKDTSYILKFNPRLVCGLDVNIGNLHFRKFSASNIKGRVNLRNQIISGDNLNFASMGGNVAMDATINASRRDSVTMKYDTKFSKVDITRLFFEMENFDQHTMTDKNVKGVLTADIKFASVWSNDLTLNSRSVKSTGDITIENGELNNFTPIQALGKYIHVSDLNHISFRTLKNNISIADRKIFIPNMDINSSVINISGNGTHDFDNNIDYHIKLLLADVLGKKVKDNNTEFGVIEDDGLGHTKLFLAMKGTVDDPHFSLDRKATGEKIRNEVAQEKQNIKGILKQEFGLFKNQPSVQAPKPKKREEMQIDWAKE